MRWKIATLILLLTSAGAMAQRRDTVPTPRILKQWTLTRDFSEEKVVPFDTAASLFHRFRLADRYSPVNANLGNYGLPFYQLNFFDRVTDPDRYLAAYYYPLMHLPENALFMNTQVPYTELDWTFGAPKETSEQTFRVRHSQNVNRFLNFGLIFDIVYSLGQYNYQRAEDKTFTFYSSYTGPRYKMYFSANLNNLTAYENGGVSDKSQLGLLNTRDIPVYLGGLDKASSLYRNRNLLLVQRYTIGSTGEASKDTSKAATKRFLGLSGTFSHILVLENNSRKYNDSWPGSGFYDTILITDAVTSDSVYSGTVKNTVRFDFATDNTGKIRFGGGGGIRNEITKYSNIVPVRYVLHANPSEFVKNSNILVGRIYNNIGDKFRWLATGELYLTGYRSGDFILNGEINKGFALKKGTASWLITGSVASRQPSYWFEHWGGNNIGWNLNLDKEFRIDAGTSFSYPSRKTGLKFNYAIIDNYIGFNSSGHPEQHAGALSVAAIAVSKELKAWKFHLANDILIQKSSNSEVLDLPLATVKSAAYFEHLFRFASTGGKLFLQAGAELTFHTLYHPYGYLPSTGRFFRQSVETAGNYPFIDLFLNFKVKRTRAFVMFDHVNSGLTGYNYQMVALYPMNIRMLRYGLAWTFYN